VTSRSKYRLRGLARLCGIAVSYRDYNDALVHPPRPTLIKLINAVQDHGTLRSRPTLKELDTMLAQIKDARCRRALPPLMVAWNGRLPAGWAWLDKKKRQYTLTLTPEKGAAVTKIFNVEDEIGRGKQKRVRYRWPDKIPYGYYKFQIDDHAVFLISASRRISDRGQDWGLFAPTYALHDGAEHTGLGGYRELEQAARFTAQQGGGFFGTLPLLAGYYEGKRADISPYAPASRLFWNELLLETEQTPELAACFKEKTINYEKIYRLKKPLLQAQAQEFFDSGAAVKKPFQDYLSQTPYLQQYAAFRAAQVPKAQREQERQFHLYVQFACHRALSTMKKAARSGDSAALYLDYPVGLHRESFDAVHFKSLFLEDFTVGAPPDLFYSHGQNWGFHPYDPRGLEHERLRYFRATLHAHFRYARMLRLDHIMGFHRIFCIPAGVPPTAGTYLHYPFEAFLAVMCLEAKRHGAVLIGEDLGTVPEIVRRKMQDHNIARMWILQFELRPDPNETAAGIRPDMIASFNTHDMFPLAAFVNGEDMTLLIRHQLLDPARAKDIRKERRQMLKGWDKGAIKARALADMAKSSARHVMVNIEDLWDETKPQNIPGDSAHYPNWRRRVRLPTEQWGNHPGVQHALKTLNQNRSKDHAL